MWEFGPWLSPEHAVRLWLGGLVLTVLATMTSRFMLAALLIRAAAWLVLLQGLCITVAAGWGYYQPIRHISVNDVYVVGAPVISILAAAAVVWLLHALRADPTLFARQTFVRTPGGMSPVDKLLAWGGCTFFVLGPVSLWLWAFDYSNPSSTGFMCVAFTLATAAAAAWLELGVELSSGWRVCRGLLTVGALMLLVPFTFLRPLGGMTDDALFRLFKEKVADGSVSGPAMTELQRRPRSRFSGLAEAVETMRAQPAALSAIVAARRISANQSNYAGCSMVVSLDSEPLPYEGKPELDLLAVLVSRWELEVPRAWEQDPGVDEELRNEISTLLGNPIASNLPSRRDPQHE